MGDVAVADPTDGDQRRNVPCFPMVGETSESPTEDSAPKDPVEDQRV